MGRRPAQFQRRGDLEPGKEVKGSLVASAPPLSAIDHVIERSILVAAAATTAALRGFFLATGVRYLRERVVGGVRRIYADVVPRWGNDYGGGHP